MTDFETKIKGVFNPDEDMPKLEKSPETIKQKQPDKKDVENNWKERSNQVLKERGSKYRVSNPWHNFLIFILVLAISVGIGFFCWGIYDDKFSNDCTDNSEVICEAPNFECPKIPECPSCSLNCGDTNITINPEIYTNYS